MQAQTRSEGVSNLSSDPPLSGCHTLGCGEDIMEHQIELTDNVRNIPHDLPLPRVNTPRSDEGSLELNELMDLVTKLSHRVFDLEKVKTTQEKRQSLGMVFVQEKDAKNQGKIGTDDIEVVKRSGDTEVLDTKKAVNTAGKGTLIKTKEEKPKEKGVAIKDVEDSSRPVRSITTLQPLPTIDPKDKGKGILQDTKSMEKTNKKVQVDAHIERDAEIALRLQAELDEELRARIDADYELVLDDIISSP
ncbi:hypothetical protein Tco_1006692 [Tanacetum coccineum]|uniref:Uncharacterized protein n=1 Tax=Tanacetum coccineum TaxID=301880 RepID=A0ABQ5FJB3_9ASTR